MMVLSTVLKALFLVALPVTLASVIAMALCDTWRRAKPQKPPQENKLP